MFVSPFSPAIRDHPGSPPSFHFLLFCLSRSASDATARSGDPIPGCLARDPRLMERTPKIDGPHCPARSPWTFTSYPGANTGWDSRGRMFDGRKSTGMRIYHGIDGWITLLLLFPNCSPVFPVRPSSGRRGANYSPRFCFVSRLLPSLYWAFHVPFPSSSSTLMQSGAQSNTY